MKFVQHLLVAFACGVCFGVIAAQVPEAGAEPAAEAGLDSGGPLSKEQAAYDVLRYDLDLEVFAASRRIAGHLTLTARAVASIETIVLDLNERLRVDRVFGAKGQVYAHRQAEGRLFVELGAKVAEGEEIWIRVHYAGTPRVAPNPPWDGGFTWAETPSGSPWIATSCQTNGADLWWPCKDHPSDEPLGMSITITVKKPLVVASNGRLVAREDLEDDRQRFRWVVSTPISTYAVALAIAPYVELHRTMTSVTGEEFPVHFFALPENQERAEKFLDQVVLRDVAWFEKTFGPYPFRGDKYGVAETPFLGMEHQSIIAYGNRYQVRRGYDWLHHHELAHEWWGNLVTVADWRDFWIHEGIGTYCQALFLGDLRGEPALRAELKRYRSSIRNQHPVAPRDGRGARQVYVGEAGLDIYYKGALIVHALGSHLGRETLLEGLRRFLYPTDEARRSNDGSACRSVSTADFIATFEALTGEELDWFFEAYLRRPELPRLAQERKDGRLELRWEVPGVPDFALRVPVKVGGERQIVAMKGGRGSIAVPEGLKVEIDPDQDLLFELLPPR